IPAAFAGFFFHSSTFSIAAPTFFKRLPDSLYLSGAMAAIAGDETTATSTAKVPTPFQVLEKVFQSNGLTSAAMPVTVPLALSHSPDEKDLIPSHASRYQGLSHSAGL